MSKTKTALAAAAVALLLLLATNASTPGVRAGTPTPEETVQSIFDELNQGDADDAAALVSEDFILTDITAGSAAFVGRAAFEFAVQGAIDVDAEITVVEMDTDADGDTVTGTIEWRDDTTVDADVERYIQDFTVEFNDDGVPTSGDFVADESDADTAAYIDFVQAQEDDEGPPPGAVTVPLAAQPGGNQPGSAFIFDLEPGVTGVVLAIEPGAAGVLQLAHFHTGTCAAPGPIVEPLASVLDGFSFTALSTTMDELVDNDLIINVHKSAAEPTVYVSCGEALSAPPAASPTVAAPVATATTGAVAATPTRPTGVTAPDTGTGDSTGGSGGSALPYALLALGGAIVLLGAGTLATRRR